MSKVIITNEQKEVKIPTGVKMLVRRCCNAVLLYEGFKEAAEVSVTFVDDERIHSLNKEYRDVEPVGRFAENTVCGIENYRYQAEPKKSSKQFYAPKAFGFYKPSF